MAGARAGVGRSARLMRNCLRLLLGVLKIALIAPFFYKGWNELLVAGRSPRCRLEVLRRVPGRLLFLSALSVLQFRRLLRHVIAASRLFGMRLPENFNRPYLARNVIEFWTRWHITLGLWIRDYLFMPMYKPVVSAGRSGPRRWPGSFISWPLSWRGPGTARR